MTLRLPLAVFASALFLASIAHAQEWAKQVEIVAEADSLEGLVSKAKPTFAWGPGDMLWVKEPEPGKVTFSVNRAVRPQGATRSDRGNRPPPSPAA